MNYPFPNAGLLRPASGYGGGLLSGPGPLDDEFARLRMMNAQSPILAMQRAAQQAQQMMPKAAPTQKYVNPFLEGLRGQYGDASWFKGLQNASNAIQTNLANMKDPSQPRVSAIQPFLDAYYQR
jgi:hypothetical protein